MTTAEQKHRHTSVWSLFNTLRPRQIRRHFADDVSQYIFLNENDWISFKMLLRFVPKLMGPINIIPTVVQKMACCRPGEQPLSEPIMVILLTHICVSWRQWVMGCMRGVILSNRYPAEQTHTPAWTLLKTIRGHWFQVIWLLLNTWYLGPIY